MHFQRHQQWLNSLGDAVVNLAIPFKDTHAVQADGTDSPDSASTMSGLNMIRIGSLEESLAAAQSCPFPEIDGMLQVSEIVGMSGQPGDQASEKLN